MNEKLIKTTASIGLILGAILGMAGSFVSSPYMRSLAWGIDGIGLILAGALLVVYFFRKGCDIMAAGFLIFIVGESLILSYNGINLDADISTFGAGAGLWATSIALISSQRIFPIFVRGTGFIAAILFAIVSIQIFIGDPLNALSKPLPFGAYPFFALTVFGWTWSLLRSPSI